MLPSPQKLVLHLKTVHLMGMTSNVALHSKAGLQIRSRYSGTDRESRSSGNNPVLPRSWLEYISLVVQEVQVGLM